MEYEDFEEVSDGELMRQAQDLSLKSAKQVGILASRAWDAVERGDYAAASTIYSIISRTTASLANQTFSMTVVKFNEEMGTDSPDST